MAFTVEQIAEEALSLPSDARAEIGCAMRFEFHPDAFAEYEDAARYYSQCQDGLELRFIATVEHAVQQIIEAPER